MSAEFDFKAYLGKAKVRVEAALDGSLGPERPESLREAMRYSLLAGGKRLRVATKIGDRRDRSRVGVADARG